MPLSETTVMLATENLAIGVILGVVTAMIAFARRVAHVARVDKLAPGSYKVTGQLFFASSNDLACQFDYTDEADKIIVDLTDAEAWDASAVAAIDTVIQKYEKPVEIIGLDGHSKARLDRLSGA